MGNWEKGNWLGVLITHYPLPITHYPLPERLLGFTRRIGYYLCSSV